jgi:hypothetical protein
MADAGATAALGKLQASGARSKLPTQKFGAVLTDPTFQTSLVGLLEYARMAQPFSTATRDQHRFRPAFLPFWLG